MTDPTLLIAYVPCETDADELKAMILHEAGHYHADYQDRFDAIRGIMLDFSKRIRRVASWVRSGRISKTNTLFRAVDSYCFDVRLWCIDSVWYEQSETLGDVSCNPLAVAWQSVDDAISGVKAKGGFVGLSPNERNELTKRIRAFYRDHPKGIITME